MNYRMFGLPTVGFRPRLLVLFFVGMVGTFSIPQEAPISSQERSIVSTMLDEVKSDIKGNYYDPKFHGVDVDSRFREAAELIKKAKTYNQAIATVGWALRPLNDSHTFLVPPRRSYKFVYGFQYMMVGNSCFVSAVEPGSDAEKGLKVGDRILTFNKVTPSRENLWELGYLFRVLRPQANEEFLLQNSDGAQRTLVLAPKVVGETFHLNMGIDYWDFVREYQSYRHLVRRRSHAIGESVIIWNFPTFVVTEKAVDEMMAKSAKYPAMILDLRGNGGGSVDALLRLVGSVVDHDVDIGKPIVRKPIKPLSAKSRGDKAYRGKLIVLIDAGSASASELFARTMQLQKRATVVGDKSSGSVMEARFHFHLLGLDSGQGYGVMVSEADIEMPDGKSLEHEGVIPDEVVLPTANDLANRRDPVLSRAVMLAGGDLSPDEAGKLFPIEWPKQ